MRNGHTPDGQWAVEQKLRLNDGTSEWTAATINCGYDRLADIAGLDRPDIRARHRTTGEIVEADDGR